MNILASCGFDNDYYKDYYDSADEAAGTPARVTAVHRERWEVISRHGEGFARLKSGVYYAGEETFPTVGDFVLLDHNPSGDSRITATLPRRTVFLRADPSTNRHTEQAVAANFDYVFIMQSMNMDFNPKRLERYLTLGWQSGAQPVVVLTKADLAADHSAYLAQVESVAPGVKVHAVSALTGAGMDSLRACLEPGQTVVFLGSSGVGKSSLVNALAGVEVMAVGGIREEDSRGRHTTTHRQLITLPDGVMVIDTPGMRELGMWEVSEGIGEAFADVEAVLGGCRFSDCTHTTEPGCAVRAAIEEGALSAQRWESYQRLSGEGADKEEMLRRKRDWSKRVAKFSRQRKKEIW